LTWYAIVARVAGAKGYAFLVSNSSICCAILARVAGAKGYAILPSDICIALVSISSNCRAIFASYWTSGAILAPIATAMGFAMPSLRAIC
jgi:hypothetical protein